MKKILALAIVCFGTSAFAQYILNPGQYNATGMVLTCQPAYQPNQPVLVGYYTTVPNIICVNAAPTADPKTIDNALRGCDPIVQGAIMSCTSRQVISAVIDQNCYASLYAKETLPAAIHTDQGQRLKDVCTSTRYACYR